MATTEDPMEAVMLMRQQYERKILNLVAEIDGAMADETENIRNTIETVPSSLKPGKVGRVYTGDMLDSVEHKELSRTGGRRFLWKGSFGWVTNAQQYFGAQEYGTGNKSGEGGVANISPMHALTGAMIGFRQRVGSLWR